MQCAFVHAERTRLLEGGSFGASLLRNDEEEHGREEHGPTVAGLLAFPHRVPALGRVWVTMLRGLVSWVEGERTSVP